MNLLYEFINLELNKGHNTKEIKIMLISKGLPDEIVDMAFEGINARDRKLRDYIEKALNLGHKPEEIKESLLRVGWQEAEVEKNMSETAEKIN